MSSPTYTSNATSAQNLNVQMNEQIFFQIMKKNAVKRDKQATTIEEGDLKQTLKYFNKNSKQSKSLQKSLHELLEVDDSSHSVRLSRSLRPKVAHMIKEGIPNFKFNGAYQLYHMRNYYQDIKRVASNAVPAQEDKVRAIASDLSSQIFENDSNKAKRLLLHSRQGGGALEIAEAVANEFVNKYGYEVLKVDCSNYRSAGEASSWTGSKSYWSGSSSGEITSQIYRHPKSIILLNRFDETLPQVMDSIRDALTKGELIDSYGITEKEERYRRNVQPTVVDCKQAIFICTASLAIEWLEHPDATNILGDTYKQQRKNLFNQLRMAEKQHRGEMTPIFSSAILDQLENHYHVLNPLTWKTLNIEAVNNMSKLENYSLRQTGKKLVIKAPFEKLAQLALLNRGDEMKLAYTKPVALYQQFVESIFEAQMEINYLNAIQIELEISESQLKVLDIILNRLGKNPQVMLKKRNQFVDFKVRVDSKNNGKAYIEDIVLKDIQRLSDYTEGGLITELPTERFSDICGHQKVVEYLDEIATYLKNPLEIKAMNINMPKGCLLYGPPGTGKTLLAKAMAGEADIPFIATSGSNLLDREYRQNVFDITNHSTPCVLFIDEADALASRSESSVHNIAVNELLTHIDGFHETSQLFIIMATNHPNKLDHALLRSGRIDKYFEISHLDANARAKYLSDHLWGIVKLTKSEKNRVIKHTSGFTGADLQLLIRNIGLRLIREHRKKASFKWVMQEITQMNFGDNCDFELTHDFRYATAVHEAGHAVLQHLLFPHRPLSQVSIIPNSSGTAGYTAWTKQENTIENQTITTVKQEMQVDLAGRASEILYLGEEGKCLGSSSDLHKASTKAFIAITQAGLDEEFGPISLGSLTMNGRVPEHLHTLAVNRTKYWVDEASKKALNALKEHKHKVDVLIEALLKKEILDDIEILEVLQSVENSKK